ncbi:Protein of uncharacterised function (DUF1281) [Klebsiella pneumoniae]|nr:Protein of uncharacterised function (DUF1281) [Klebsiella pneumoniae]
MPNWCSNRLDITLHNAADMPALKHWIYADDGIPAWQTAIAQSLHLLLAGCAGILKPVRPLSFSAVTGTDFIRCNRACFPGKHGFHALG